MATSPGRSAVQSPFARSRAPAQRTPSRSQSRVTASSAPMEARAATAGDLTARRSCSNMSASLSDSARRGKGPVAIGKKMADLVTEQAVVATLNRLDWPGIESSLDAQGFAKLPPILTAAECEALVSLYKEDAL